MATSIYEPLENDDDSFRLIRIHLASSSQTPIQADLVIAKLSKKPDYEALSYVWGPPPNECHVNVNGKGISIRANLDDFLRVLRGTGTEPRLVYADAICINQADNSEKEFQVQMMGKIYENATAVLSYLGPGDDDTDALFRASTRVKVEDYTIIRKDNSQGERGVWKEGIFEESELDIFKPTMHSLVNRDYWKRAWIVQECLLANEVYVYCGSSSASWEGFLHMYMFLIDKEPVAKTYSWGYIKPEWTTITRFDHIAGQRARKDKYPVHIADVVTYFNTTECMDPRDKVFAFLGLMKESEAGHPRRLVADYSMTPTELFFLACHAYIFSPDSGRPHRIIPSLQGMLGLTAKDLLDAVCELIDPDELVSSVDWIVGHLGDLKDGRVFRTERRPENTPYMECFERDFSTLTRLQNERRARME